MIQITHKGETYSYQVDGKTPVWLSSLNIIAPVMLQSILRRKAIAEGLSLSVKTQTKDTVPDADIKVGEPAENTTKVIIPKKKSASKPKTKSRKVPVSSVRGKSQGKYKILIVQPQ